MLELSLCQRYSPSSTAQPNSLCMSLIRGHARNRYCLTYLGEELPRSSVIAFYCRWDSFQKGPPCSKRITARVRLPQTSLMRSDSYPVSQITICRLLGKRRLQNLILIRCGPFKRLALPIRQWWQVRVRSSSLLAHASEQHRTTQRATLLVFFVCKCVTAPSPNQKMLKPGPCARSSRATEVARSRGRSRLLKVIDH
jgi:hypothetical protein